MPPRALAWGLTGLAALAAGVALAYADAEGGVTVCMLRRLFDLPCPGCGMTRAFAALARGDLRAAVGFHPWAPAVAAQAGAAWLLWGASLLDAAPAAVRRLKPATLAVANLTVLAALWLGRLATGTLPY